MKSKVLGRSREAEEARLAAAGTPVGDLFAEAEAEDPGSQGWEEKDQAFVQAVVEAGKRGVVPVVKLAPEVADLAEEDAGDLYSPKSEEERRAAREAFHRARQEKGLAAGCLVTA